MSLNGRIYSKADYDALLQRNHVNTTLLSGFRVACPATVPWMCKECPDTTILREIPVITSVSFTWEEVEQANNGLMVYSGQVLNVTSIMQNDSSYGFLGHGVVDRVHAALGKDGTQLLSSYRSEMHCLTDSFTVGYLDQRSLGCFASDLIMTISLLVIIGIVLGRFCCAVLFDWFMSRALGRMSDRRKSIQLHKQQTRRRSSPGVVGRSPRDAPSPMKRITADDTFTFLLVTCYSEGSESIRSTLDSLAITDYDDQHKVLLVICDGIIVGEGNAQSTPDIVLGMMKLDASFAGATEPQSYFAIGQGTQAHNRARVYAGHYVLRGREIPMITIVKCGTADEAATAKKPGNRGKRDSQLVLMQFLNRVMVDGCMTPLDYDLFRKIHHITGKAELRPLLTIGTRRNGGPIRVGVDGGRRHARRRRLLGKDGHCHANGPTHHGLVRGDAHPQQTGIVGDCDPGV